MIIRSLFARLAFTVDTRGLKKFDNGLRGIKSTMIGISALWAAGTASIGYFLNEAAKMEKVEVAFKTMLGSTGRAKELLGDLFEFARITPFRIPGILGTTRILLGMGIEADKMKQRLKEIGDVAAGLSVPLEQIALSYGKVKAAGYLTGYELQNLRRAGVPLVAELSKMLGRDREEIQGMVRKRKISFEMFAAAFTSMSGPGGKFHDLMFEQSKTLLGIISNIKDAMQILAIETGKTLLPGAKKIANTFLAWLETNKALIKLRLNKFLTNIGKKLVWLTKFVAEAVRGFFMLAESLGGVEKILNIILFTLSLLIALKFTTALGNMTMSVFRFAKALLFTQGTLTAWPAVIGLALVALWLIIDDLYRYLTGWKGRTVAEWFDKKFLAGNLKVKGNAVKEFFDDWKRGITDTIALLEALWDVWSGVATLNRKQYRRGMEKLADLGFLPKEKELQKDETQYNILTHPVKAVQTKAFWKDFGLGLIKPLDWFSDRLALTLSSINDDVFAGTPLENSKMQPIDPVSAAMWLPQKIKYFDENITEKLFDRLALRNQEYNTGGLGYSVIMNNNFNGISGDDSTKIANEIKNDLDSVKLQSPSGQKKGN